MTSLGTAGLLILPWSVPAAAAPDAPGFVSASVLRAEQDPTAQDVAFVEAARRTNLAEIAAGQIAWGKTTDSTVKSVAAALMRDHIHLDAALYSTARELRIFLPEVPTPEQQALNERYRAAGADTFDEYFIHTQLAAHREALQMIETQIAEGGNEAVRTLAENARPVIERHHDQLRAAAEEMGLVGYSSGSSRG